MCKAIQDNATAKTLIEQQNNEIGCTQPCVINQGFIYLPRPELGYKSIKSPLFIPRHTDSILIPFH